MREVAIGIIKKFNDEIVNNKIIKDKINRCEDGYGFSISGSYPGILLYISQCWQLSKELDWKNAIEEYLSISIKNINDGDLELKRIGSLTFGYGGISLLGRELMNQGINLKKFIETSDERFIESLIEKIESAENRIKNHDLRYEDFDTITGLAPIGRFLIDYVEKEEFNKYLIRILNYFVKLSSYTEINNNMRPNWVMQGKNMFNDWEKNIYKNGAVNFSVSHGVGAILSLLSIAKINGIEVTGQEEAIRKIVYEYKRFFRRKDNRIFWPGIIKYEDYLNNYVPDDSLSIRDSWCYGVPGVARVLYMAGKAIGDKEVVNLASEALRLMCSSESINGFNISSAIVCHGYSGILATLVAMYKDTGESIYKDACDKLVDIIDNSFDKESVFGFFDEVFDIKENKLKKYNKTNLYEGFIGILLTLNYYVNNDKDILNKCLMLA